MALCEGRGRHHCLFAAWKITQNQASALVAIRGVAPLETLVLPFIRTELSSQRCDKIHAGQATALASILGSGGALNMIQSMPVFVFSQIFLDVKQIIFVWQGR